MGILDGGARPTLVVNVAVPSLPPAVTHWAKSVLLSRTLWFNAISGLVALLDEKDILKVLPASWHDKEVAAVLVGNMLLRFATVRPVAFTGPGTTLGVKVDNLSATTPTVVPAAPASQPEVLQ